jgi:protein-tyrosine phosphatase
MVYVPASDDFDKPPPRETLAAALKASAFAAHRITQGGNVFVSCWAGINRSGLVTALTIHRLTGFSGTFCVGLIKRARPRALQNPQFLTVLHRIPTRSPPTSGVGQAA